jgi:hypothetical protein
MGWEYQHPHATPSRVERRGRGCERDALHSMGSLFASNDVDAGKTESSCRQTCFRGDLPTRTTRCALRRLKIECPEASGGDATMTR